MGRSDGSRLDHPGMAKRLVLEGIRGDGKPGIAFIRWNEPCSDISHVSYGCGV